MEQYFKILLGLVIEIIQMSIEAKRMLAYSLKYKIALGISSFLFLLMAGVLFLTVFKAIRNIRKLKENPALNLVVTQGLNKA